MELSSAWMERAREKWKEAIDSSGYRGLFFPIVQGNFFQDLRTKSAERAVQTEPQGIAIGGLSVGEPEEVFLEYLAFTANLLPKELPRYVMGIGTPEYVLGAIEHGVDMFDCVFPTRNARNGNVFTRQGAFALKKADNRLDFSPIDKECGCKVCRSYSRAYLRHLFRTREITCSILASYHNLYFMNELVKNAREAIMENRFTVFKKDFLKRYMEGKNDA